MNYNHLRYFSVLAQVEHYTIAAARLGISQPSLSSAIHNLENDLGGVPLFEKVGRNIRLTSEGRYYQQKVDAALEELNNATMVLKSSHQGAPVLIRLGYVSGTLDGVIAREIAAHIQENSRIHFQLTEGSSGQLMDLVRQEKLDMAIVDTTDRDRSLHFRKLRERNFYAALPRTHPLADRVQIEPQELANSPQIVPSDDIGNSFEQWASGSPISQNVICTVNTTNAAIDLVATGVGVAFVPDECIRKQEAISFVPIENWHQALYMCTLYDKWLEPLIYEFVDRVVKTVRNSTKTP